LSFALSFFTVAAELNEKVEELFRNSTAYKPTFLATSFPADRRNYAPQVSKNRAKALLMKRVIGEVGEDVKHNVFPRGREKKGAHFVLTKWDR
jgi:hypothetical protein